MDIANALELQKPSLRQMKQPVKKPQNMSATATGPITSALMMP